MKAIWLYRTAAVLLILFAAGHTFGFLNFKAPTAEGVAVFDAMNHVRFTARGATYSYGDFYRGFGLYISVYLLFSMSTDLVDTLSTSVVNSGYGFR